MSDDRSQLGSLISAAGGAVLAVSVFLPWYGVSLTGGGASFAAQQMNGVAQRYGNSALQGIAGGLSQRFSALAGRQLGTVSAHQSLKIISVVLLILAAIAFAASLARLAGSSVTAPDRGWILLAGVAATLCVLYRMVEPPDASQSLISVSLSPGIWLALLSAVAIMVGGLWSEREQVEVDDAPGPAQAWQDAPSWTPGA